MQAIIAGFFSSASGKWRKISKWKKIFILSGFVLLVFLCCIFWNVPRWHKQYRFRTVFVEKQEGIGPVSEEEVLKEISGKCEELRKESGRLYAPREISAAIPALGDEKIILAGADLKSEPD